MVISLVEIVYSHQKYGYGVESIYLFMARKSGNWFD